MNPNQTFTTIHKCRIVHTVDPNGPVKTLEILKSQEANKSLAKDGKPLVDIPPYDGWLHELFELDGAEWDGSKWLGGTPGKSLGLFPTAGLAIAAAKKLNPPEKAADLTDEIAEGE